MEASTYAWAVILTFFIFYGTIQVRKCCLQLLSSGETNTSTNRLSSSSVYTIETDSTLHSVRNDQEILGSINSFQKTKDDLPTYEEVVASERQNSINSSGLRGISTATVSTSSSNTL